jgi:hypothetical protein
MRLAFPRLALLLVALAPAALTPAAVAQPGALAAPAVLADGEGLDGWSAVAPDGISLRISQGEGRAGRAIRLDYDFNGHGGYAIARRALDLRLPENYRFRFWMRAEGADGGPAPVNDLEFKLVDPSGLNVWWHNRRRLAYPVLWTPFTSKARHVSFAWGPARGGPPGALGSLEIVVTAQQGGRGTVWLDDLTVEPLPPDAPYTLTPAVAVSAGSGAEAVLDGDPATGWRAPAGRATLTLDFLRPREFGGLALDWGPGLHAPDYDILTSLDGREWAVADRVRGARGGRDWSVLPESEARFVRLALFRAAGAATDLRAVEVLPLSFGETPNTALQARALHAPRGHLPRALRGEGVFWTVIGLDRDEAEAMMGEDGEVEIGKERPALEPFLYTGGRLLTWADADSVTQALHDGALPIPSATRHHGALRLETTAFAVGDSGRAVLYVRYRVAGATAPVRLFVAARPWSVNPPYQFLNGPGGYAPLRTALPRGHGGMQLDHQVVQPLSAPAATGTARLVHGDLTEWFAAGAMPPAVATTDHAGLAQAAWAFDVAPGEEVWLAAGLDARSPMPEGGLTPAAAAAHGAARLAEAAAAWTDALDGVEITGPPDLQRIARTLKTQAAYVLVNRDGAAIQPGSRSYDRSWIRDGSLTSSAMLRLGYPEVAQDFARWFAPKQYPSGKVPCCVDERGGDPVPENDSHGQLIFLIAETHRYTGDDAFLREMWPHVGRTVAFIDSLRHTRMGPAYTGSDSARAYYGLLPESISHEGYSERPVHSYWDQLFALRGLKDAVYIAEALGEDADAARFRAIRDAFHADLTASYRRTMAQHAIPYVPGSVELGDEDPTSVTIVLDPAEAPEVLPEGALRASFDRYWDFVRGRADGSQPWTGYTPYELRAVGTFVRLGTPERAWAALDFFFAHQRPAGWYQWAEVVWPDPRTARYVGDMPHTWVGSDFVRSALDLFAYHEETRLVLGAGLKPAWLDAPGGVGIRRLQTPWGPLAYTAQRSGGVVTLDLAGGLRLPPDGITVRLPLGAPRTATVDGQAVPRDAAGHPVLRAVPARLVLRY